MPRTSPTPEDYATKRLAAWPVPGPGTWELDTTHYAPDVARLVRDLMEDASPRGFEEGMTLVGAPLQTIAARFVNGRYYLRLVPVVGANSNLPDPPAPVLWLATRLHPEFRRRTKRAAAVLADRIWMNEFERWEREWKPALIEANTRFGAVTSETLSDDDLAAHIGALYEHLRFSMALHFRLHISDLGPIGVMLVKGRDLGLDTTELMASLTGSSPATTSPDRALHRVREIVADAGIAGTKRPDTLEAVRALSSEAAALVDEYVQVFGDRLTTGYDVRDRTLREVPNVMLSSMTAPPPDRSAPSAQTTGDGIRERLLAQVPEAERTALATSIDDARALYGLRDENGPLTYEWPMGIMRGAVLEAGRRLVGRDALPEEAGVFDLTAAEMAALLRGASTPTPSEIADRTAVRKAWADIEAPSFLGRPPVEPPLDALPGPMADLMRITLIVLELIEASGTNTPMRGLGIGDQTYVGRACVVNDAMDALDRMELGDVLVAPFTVPTYNTVLAMAGAVVVENGGLLCHAAVIAREFGISAIVGATGATTEIANGQLVEVDPVAGTVRVVKNHETPAPVTA